MPGQHDDFRLIINGSERTDLQLVAFAGREAMSRLYEFHLDILADNSLLDQGTLGADVGFGVVAGIDSQGTVVVRWFHGIVSAVTRCGYYANWLHQRITVVPKLWKLTKIFDCYSYVEKKATDIVTGLLKGYGLNPELTPPNGEPVWEYCTQYRETDFHFVSRLLEEMGLYYFFKHEQSSHQLVISATPSTYATCAGMLGGGICCAERMGGFGVDVVQSWESKSSLVPSAYTLADYSHFKPLDPLRSTTHGLHPHAAASSLKLYDYPGKFWQINEGHALSRIRMEEVESEQETVLGSGACLGFSPGYKFTPNDSFPAGSRVEHVITEVVHAGCNHEIRNSVLASRLVTREYDVPIHPELWYGNTFACVPCQTFPYRPPRIAKKVVVEGPQTATVVSHPDEFCRVKAKFHWMRGDQDPCFIRIAQIWASKNWGALFVPHIGDEVVVDFIEGDPDHPMITGRVYNSVNELHAEHKLPDNKTRTGIITKKNNEFRIEDKDDAEQIFFNACKDFERVVEKDDKTTVTSGDMTITVKAGKSTTTADKDITIESKAGKSTTTADKDITIESKTGTVTIKAATKIELVVGGSKITIEAAKIAISAATVETRGSGMVQEQGAMVKIN